VLWDSNIIIYAAQPQNADFRSWVAAHDIHVSALSQVEVLGYHKLSEAECSLFSQFFASVVVLPITAEIISTAINLRQQKRTGLGDSIIAATGLVHNLTIATHNLKDFQWIPNLNLVDPLSL
jgi:toxin FitB